MVVRLLDRGEVRVAVGHVELDRQQRVAVLLGQVVEGRGVARGGGDLVAALQGRDRPLPAEAARCPGDEPNFFSSCLVSMPAIALGPFPDLSKFTGSVAGVSRATLDKDPHEVASMFDAVARRYDLTNTVLSLGPGPVLAAGDALGAAHRARRQGARPGGGHRGVDGRAGGVGGVVCGRGLLGRHARGRAPRATCRRSRATRRGCRSPTGCSTR